MRATTSTTTDNTRQRARRIIEECMRVVIPLGCTAWLMSWLFHKVDFHRVMATLHGSDVIYWPFLGLMLFNFLSYIIRANRWGLQLRGVGAKPREGELCVSIFGAYALNLVMQGVGEAWRCVFISRREDVSLSKVVGTDVGDRASDAIVVIMVLLLAMVVAGPTMHDFAARYGVDHDIMRLIHDRWLWGIIALVIVIWLTLSRLMRHNSIVADVNHVLSDIWEGFRVLFTMPQKGRYLWLTLGIWICYFMQTYVCFQAFPFTRVLLGSEYCYGLLPGMIVMLFGSLSMAIPSSGGLGPWNIAVMFALTLYGVSSTEAAAFALVAWSAEALLQVLQGIYTLIWISMHKRKSATTAPSR